MSVKRYPQKYVMRWNSDPALKGITIAEFCFVFEIACICVDTDSSFIIHGFFDILPI